MSLFVFGYFTSVRHQSFLDRRRPEIRPNYGCALFAWSYPFKRLEDLEAFLDGLRKAGLPE